VEIGRKLRKRFALGLADIEDVKGLNMGMMIFFPRYGFPVRVQHGSLVSGSSFSFRFSFL
jgi:hypothetical protein